MNTAASTQSATANPAHTGSRAGVLPATAHLSVITTLQNLRALEADWRALEADCQKEVNVFQSFDWIASWCETYAADVNDADCPPALHVLAGYDEGRLVFLWPLMRVETMGLSVLKWLTDPFGQYGDVLCATHQCANTWMESSIALLRRFNDVDLLWLRHVRADGHVGTYGPRLLRDARLTERAPYLDLTPFKTEEDYDARYTAVQRKRRKKIRKHLENSGPVTFERLPPGSQADAAMTQAIAEKNLWLKERGRMNRVLRCPRHVQFLRTLSRRTNSAVDVVVTELAAGGKPVSWEIGFRLNGIHFAYITSHVNALTNLSPGRLHMDLSQRGSIAAGLKRFDLMVPYDAHKESWSSDCAVTNDYFLPLTLPGRLAGWLYLQTLRPLLRKTYYKLHPRLPQLRQIMTGARPAAPSAES